MEQRAGKLGQMGRGEPTLASAHSETCPVYLGHSPQPNLAAGPAPCPPSTGSCKGEGSRTIEVWGQPCSPEVVPHPRHSAPGGPHARAPMEV